MAAQPTRGSSQPLNASRLRVDSPRETRHAYSLRIERREAELEDRVERRVGVLEHRAEQPVDLVGGDRVQRDPPVQVDVAEVVDGERDAVHLRVALEQPAVDGLVVLVRAPGDERVHRTARARPTVSEHGGLQLALPRQVRRRTRPGSLSVNSSSFSVSTWRITSAAETLTGRPPRRCSAAMRRASALAVRPRSVRSAVELPAEPLGVLDRRRGSCLVATGRIQSRSGRSASA